ncbi:MAG: chaperonin GroEL [Alphaproteobacteria bacterium]|jgi:chaperonin GroEL|nr:chaperonin GroEL [Alphaproteobacteria bacterium]
MGKLIVFSDQARQQIKQGVDKLANAVKTTLGPKGRNVVISASFGLPHSTKDGVTVAKAIDLKDPVENLGAKMVQEVASKTADHAGDGTTTATVLAQSIYSEGVKSVVAGMNPMDVKRGIDNAVKQVVKSIKDQSKEVKQNEEIAQVATISANGDKDLGKMIAHAMDKVGKEGVISVEEAKGMETTVDVVEGMQFDKGYMSPYFITNPDKLLCEFDNPYILITDSKIANVQAIVPLLENISQSGKPLLIIAEDIEGDALSTLVINRLRGGLKICAVKAPGFGDNKKETLLDLATLTNATVISEDLGMKLENTSMQMLGRCKKISVSKETTTVVDGAADKEDVEQRVSEIRHQIKSAKSYDKDKLQERLARLAGGVAVIRIGGSSEIEVKEKKDRIDDALCATRAAVEEGIVCGGGVALLNAIKGLDKVNADNQDQQSGINIIKNSLQTPLRQICANAGVDGAVVVGKILENKDYKFGYDAYKDEYKDMFKNGIIDPAKVVRSAIEDAASVAGILITTECVVADEPKSENSCGHDHGHGNLNPMGMM